ncbi:MAG: hypothetical protein K8T25_20240 [Planctomycetia bacterium]|nr:hypothetical protein [Planctomycetia bacterium]
MYRHGDILVAPVASIPSGATRVQHLVLAEGELTGHAHRISEAGSAVLYRTSDELFLDVVGQTATLIHQEHGPIDLSQGKYRVWRQREYAPREIRVIRD